MRSKITGILLSFVLACVITFAASGASAAETDGMRVPFRASDKPADARETLREIITDSIEITGDKTIDGVNIKDPSEYYGLMAWNESGEPVNVDVLGDFIVSADMKDRPYWLYALDLDDNTAARIGKDFIFSVTNMPDLHPGDEEYYDVFGVNIYNASVGMKDFTMNAVADPDITDAYYPLYGIYASLEASPEDGDSDWYIKTGNVNTTAVADCDCEGLSLTALELFIDDFDIAPWKSTVWANGGVNASGVVKNGDSEVFSVYANIWTKEGCLGSMDMKIDGAVNAEAGTNNGMASAYAVTFQQMPVVLSSGPITASARSDFFAMAKALWLTDMIASDLKTVAVVNGSVTASAEANGRGTDGGNAVAYALEAIAYPGAALEVTVNGDVMAKSVNRSEDTDETGMDEAWAIEASGSRTDIFIKGDVKAECVGPYLYSEGVDAIGGAHVSIDGDVDVTAEGKDADGYGIYAVSYSDDERPTAVTARDINVTVNSGKPTEYTYGIQAYGPAKVQVRNVTVNNGTGIDMSKDASVTVNGDLNVPSVGLNRSAIKLLAEPASENSGDKGALVIRGTVDAPDGAGIMVFGDWIDKSELVGDMPALVPDIFVHGFKVGGNIAEGKGVDAEGETEYDLTQEEMREFLSGINYIVDIAEPGGYTVNVTGGADWNEEYGFYYAQAGDVVDFSVTLPDQKHGIRYVTGGDGNQIVDHGGGAYSLIIDENGGAAIDVRLYETVYAAIGRTYAFGGKTESGEPMEWQCTKVDHGAAKLRLKQGFEKGKEPDDAQLLKSLPESLRSIMVSDRIEYEDEVSERIFKDGLSHPIVYVNVFDITC